MSTSEGSGPLGRHRPRPDRETILEPTDPCRHDASVQAGACGLCSLDRANAIEAVLRTNVSADEEPTHFNWVLLLTMSISALIVGGCLYGSISMVLDRLHG
jgi:hypothetical protein